MKLAYILVAVAAVTLLVACSPESREPEVAETPPDLENGSFTAVLNGFTIHYEVHGQGPVLMTVPNSWGLSLEGLRALYRPLEGRLTMVYFDPRGMGDSGPIVEPSDMGMAAVRADFDALRRHLGLDEVAAIGWSNGAGNLILLAAEHPDTVTTAIFLHGFASFTEEDGRTWAEQNPEVAQAYAAFMQQMADEELTDEEKTAILKRSWLEEIFPFSCADQDAAATLLSETFAGAQFSWTHANYSNQEASVFDARDKLASITAHCLVVAGAHDSFPPSKTEELHAGLANSRFLLFESSGHFAQVEEPEAFRASILDFVELE